MFRKAQLRPDRAEQYPFLVPGRWYTAAAAAELVKACGPMTAERHRTRLLRPEDFEFRGGTPRVGGVALGTRRADRREEPHPRRERMRGTV